MRVSMSKAKQVTKETIAEMGVLERNFPVFKVGDTIAISQIIKEGDKQRIQIFQGDVLAIRGVGISRMVTVRKIGPNGIAVERIFPYYSPYIESIGVVRQGKVRRAKLYYIRDLLGKAARVKEKVLTRKQKEQQANKATSE